MRVALIGEFSGIHSELAKGLRKLGHEVHVYSSGDGFKKFESEYYWGPSGSSHINFAVYLFLQQPKLLNMILSDYDVVQFVNPTMLMSPKSFSNLYLSNLLRLLRSTSSIKILAVAGCDARVFPNMQILKSPPCPGCLADDNFNVCQYTKNREIFRSMIIENFVDFIIPFGSPVYASAYSYSSKNRLPLMFPIETENVAYQPNQIIDKKITVLHGLNRPGFKGTQKIKAVFSKVNIKYPNTFKFLLPDRLPFNEYLNLLYKANVVVDQLHGNGLGMNALYSLATGRVVMTCCDYQINLGQVNLTTSPTIHVDDEDSLEKSLISLAEWSNDSFLYCGEMGRQFVEMNCKADIVAANLLSEIGRH